MRDSKHGRASRSDIGMVGYPGPSWWFLPGQSPRSAAKTWIPHELAPASVVLGLQGAVHHPKPDQPMRCGVESLRDDANRVEPE